MSIAVLMSCVLTDYSDDAEGESSYDDITVSIAKSGAYSNKTLGTVHLTSSSYIYGSSFTNSIIDAVVIEGNFSQIGVTTSTTAVYPAFEGATINKVIIKPGCTSIPAYCFASSDVKALEFDEAVADASVAIQDSAFKQCLSLDHVDFHKIKSVNSYSFAYCGFTSLDLYNLPGVYRYTFAGCTKLASLNIHNDVVIGSCSFSGDVALEHIIGAEHITSIQINAFEGCPKLSGTLNCSSLTYLYSSAFSDSNNIRIVVPETCRIIINDHIRDAGLLSGLHEIEATGGKVYCQKVDEGYNVVYADYSVTGVVFTDSDNVVSIGLEAFKNCIKLESIFLGPDLISIDSNAFTNCQKLSVVKCAQSDVSNILPAGVTELKEKSFSDCPSLKDLDLRYVQTIHSNAFTSCASLTKVIFKNDATVESNAFYNTSLENIVLYSSMNLGEYAFSNCASLQSVTIDSNGEKLSIPKYCFANDSKLGSVSGLEYVSDVGSNAFEGCGLDKLQFPVSVIIGSNAFRNCSVLSSVEFLSETEVGSGAFSDCHSLVSVSFDKRSKIGERAFANCSALKLNFRDDDVSPLHGVWYIESKAFEGCTSVTSLCLPASLQYLAVDSFEGCSSFYEIILEDGESEFKVLNGLLYKRKDQWSLDESKILVLNSYESATDEIYKEYSEANYLDLLCYRLTYLNGEDDCKYMFARGTDPMGAYTWIKEEDLCDSLDNPRIVGHSAYAFAMNNKLEMLPLIRTPGDYTTLVLIPQVSQSVSILPQTDIISETGTENVFSVSSNLREILVGEGISEYRSSNGMLFRGNALVSVPRNIVGNALELKITGADEVLKYAINGLSISKLTIWGGTCLDQLSIINCPNLETIQIYAEGQDVTIFSKFAHPDVHIKELKIHSDSLMFETGQTNRSNYVPESVDTLIVVATGDVIMNKRGFYSNSVKSISIVCDSLVVESAGFYSYDLDRLTLIVEKSFSMVNDLTIQFGKNQILELDLPSGSWNIKVGSGVEIYATDRSDIESAKKIVVSEGKVHYPVEGSALWINSSLGIKVVDVVSDASVTSFSLYSKEGYSPDELEVYCNGVLSSCVDGRYSTPSDSDEILVCVVYKETDLEEVLVTFDYCGFGQDSWRSLMKGRTVTELPVLDVPGYRLEGWYIDQELSKPYTNSPVQGDMVLYARFMPLGDYLDVGTVSGHFLNQGSEYVPGSFSGSITLDFTPSIGYEFKGFKVEGNCDYNVNGYSITICSLSGYVRIDAVTVYASPNDLISVVDRDSPSADEEVVLSWAVSGNEIGGTVIQDGMTWNGMPSVVLIVDDSVYLEADGRLARIDINTGEVLRVVTGLVSKSDFYHDLGYGGGYIVEYLSGKVFDTELNYICKIPSGVDYLKWNDGRFYGVSSTGELLVLDPLKIDNGVMVNQMPGRTGYLPVFSLYGHNTAALIENGYMYYVATQGSAVSICALDVEGEGIGDFETYPINSLTGYYLDDGWLTYYNGYLYITAYTSGLFGSSNVNGCSRILYFPVSGLDIDVDAMGVVELGKDRKSLTSGFVIQNGRGYVNVSMNTSRGYLMAFDIREDGRPVFSSEVETNASHGGIVASVHDLTATGGRVQIYMLSYTGSLLYVIEDIHSVDSKGNDVWSLQKAVIKDVISNYGSQAVRVGQEGQIVYYNDSGYFFCYTASEKNLYHIFLQEGSVGTWYTVSGKDIRDAVSKLLIVSVENGKVISINGNEGSYNLFEGAYSPRYGGFIWNSISDLSKVDKSCHYLVISNSSSVPLEGEQWTYDGSEYTFVETRTNPWFNGKQLRYNSTMMKAVADGCDHGIVNLSGNFLKVGDTLEIIPVADYEFIVGKVGYVFNGMFYPVASDESGRYLLDMPAGDIVVQVVFEAVPLFEYNYYFDLGGEDSSKIIGDVIPKDYSGLSQGTIWAMDFIESVKKSVKLVYGSDALVIDEKGRIEYLNGMYRYGLELKSQESLGSSADVYASMVFYVKENGEWVVLDDLLEYNGKATSFAIVFQPWSTDRVAVDYTFADVMDETMYRGLKETFGWPGYGYMGFRESADAGSSSTGYDGFSITKVDNETGEFGGIASGTEIVYALYLGETKIVRAAKLPVVSGIYSGNVDLSALRTGIYTLKVWSDESILSASCIFEVGSVPESDYLTTVNPLDKDDDVCVTISEIEFAVNSVEDGGNINISAPKAETVTLPDYDLSHIADLNGFLSFTMSQGTVNLDSGIISGLTGEVSFSLKNVASESLVQVHKDRIGNAPVYELVLTSSGNTVSALGGNARVTLPYFLEEGRNASDLVVWCLLSDGSVEEFSCIYDNMAQTVSFSTPHFSSYAIMYGSSVDNPEVELDEGKYDPVTGNVTVSGSAVNTDSVSVEVYSDGQKVKEFPNIPVIGGSFTVSFKGLAEGKYTVEVKSGSATDVCELEIRPGSTPEDGPSGDDGAGGSSGGSSGMGITVAIAIVAIIAVIAIAGVFLLKRRSA